MTLLSSRQVRERNLNAGEDWAFGSVSSASCKPKGAKSDECRVKSISSACQEHADIFGMW